MVSPSPRFLADEVVAQDDGWGSMLEAQPHKVPTEVRSERARSILSQNQSPDVPFSVSINPYRGCEHGCVYCYARPSHAYLDLSPGLDFETRIFAKDNAAELFAQALRRPGYRPEVIAIGANTDAYQPAERTHQITRRLLEIALEARQPIALISKSSLIVRDQDLLEQLASLELVQVHVSVTSLDPQLSTILEPRAASPKARLSVIRDLSAVGVPVGLMFAPVIPAINDRELEAVLEQAADAGARASDYILLRLPHELKELFATWLSQHFPDRTQRVLSLIRQARGGRLNEPQFGARMRGQGGLADMLAQRFSVASRRHRLHKPLPDLCTSRFRPPQAREGQLDLF